VFNDKRISRYIYKVTTVEQGTFHTNNYNYNYIRAIIGKRFPSGIGRYPKLNYS